MSKFITIMPRGFGPSDVRKRKLCTVVDSILLYAIPLYCMILKHHWWLKEVESTKRKGVGQQGIHDGLFARILPFEFLDQELKLAL